MPFGRAGLYTFFYASAHMTSYLALDQGFDWQAVIEDVSKRPFMVAGPSAPRPRRLEALRARQARRWLLPPAPLPAVP